MRWAITGTPGTGKTTAASRLRVDRPVVHLNELIDAENFVVGHDHDRDTTIADIDGLRAWTAVQPEDVVIESHLAHLLPVDRVIVLRCHPDTLRDRLKTRNEDANTNTAIEENIESERLDVILTEAVYEHGERNIFEIDTTEKTPDEVTLAVEDAITGRREPSVGRVSYFGES